MPNPAGPRKRVRRHKHNIKTLTFINMRSCRFRMRGINTGRLSFAELRERDKYYVDKTLLIRDLLETDDRGIYLYTRPRRFGKTTNLSMLDAFFNLEYKGRTWFDGLEISEHPGYDRYKHAFPVIRLDLGGTRATSYDSFLNKMQKSIRDAFEPHRYLLEWQDLEEPLRSTFDSLDEKGANEDNLAKSIHLLSEALASYHGEKPIILIDEYDNALSDSFVEPLQEPVADLLRRLMRESLEDNDNRGMAYLTGVIQIAHRSIFSDPNNLIPNTIFSEISDERFGFTENEVKDILTYFGEEKRFEEVERWYGGYVFGKAEVYNPYSIMRYVSNRCTPSPYWKDSGSNIVFMRLFQSMNSDNLSSITDLLTGSSIETELSQSLTYGTVTADNKSLYSLMAMAGYLKAIPASMGEEQSGSKSDDLGNDELFEISIPNEEVRKAVKSIIETVVPINTGYFSEFIRAVLEGDTKGMEERFEDILIHGNYLNLKENAYEVIMMTLMHSLVGRYHVETEHKSGFGRTDIVLADVLDDDAHALQLPQIPLDGGFGQVHYGGRLRGGYRPRAHLIQQMEAQLVGDDLHAVAVREIHLILGTVAGIRHGREIMELG